MHSHGREHGLDMRASRLVMMGRSLRSVAACH